MIIGRAFLKHMQTTMLCAEADLQGFQQDPGDVILNMSTKETLKELRMCINVLALKIANLQPDVKLKNGAKLIQAQVMEDGNFMVLCENTVNDDYVTWYYQSNDRSCHWGHYFTDFEAAYRNYCERTAK